jgi:hypothetical protein
MNIEKRYAGRGHPVKHDHYFSMKKDRQLDVLEFENGECAVFNPDIDPDGECISFHRSWTVAEMEANRLLRRK